jgi:hypothetical protein
MKDDDDFPDEWEQGVLKYISVSLRNNKVVRT